MSIGCVGASGASQASQMLAKMLSRLNDNDDDTSSSTNTASAPTLEQAKTTGLEDSSKLSSQIVGLMVMMQADGAPPSDGGNAVANAFQTIDADGSGSISQSEMETYVQGLGGTGEQADKLFASLGGDENGISEDAFAAAAEAGRPPGGPRGPRPHGAGGGDAASQVFDALDTNKDGTVSADELAVMFGGSDASSSAGSQFLAQVDTNGDGGVTKDEMASFFSSLAERARSSYSASDALLSREVSTQSVAA